MRQSVLAIICVALAGVASAMGTDESPSLYVQKILRGGVLVQSPEVADALARVFIVSLYGADELKRQEPLLTEETEHSWIVSGSFNKDGRHEGKGALRIVINKANGALVDATLPYVARNPRHDQ